MKQILEDLSNVLFTAYPTIQSVRTNQPSAEVRALLGRRPLDRRPDIARITLIFRNPSGALYYNSCYE